VAAVAVFALTLAILALVVLGPPPPSTEAPAETAPPPTAIAPPSMPPGGPVTPSPTASPAARTDVPRTPIPTVGGPVGLGEARTVRFEGCVRASGCQLFETAADAAWVVGVIHRAADRTLQVVAVEVATGAATEVTGPAVTTYTLGDVNGGLVVFEELLVNADGTPRTWRVWKRALAGPAGAVKVDEFPVDVPLGGGDALRPVPGPLTNGRDVVWRRARADGGVPRYEVVLARGDDPAKVIHTSRELPLFAIDERGRVAIATAATTGQVRLAVQEPDAAVPRDLRMREGVRGGPVHWMAGRIAWFEGYLTAQPARRLDLVDPADGRRLEYEPLQGCGLLLPTARHLLLTCGDHLGGSAAATLVEDLPSGARFTYAQIAVADTHAILSVTSVEQGLPVEARRHQAVLPP
jgi:hypothetical protein